MAYHPYHMEIIRLINVRKIADAEALLRDVPDNYLHREELVRLVYPEPRVNNVPRTPSPTTKTTTTNSSSFVEGPKTPLSASSTGDPFLMQPPENPFKRSFQATTTANPAMYTTELEKGSKSPEPSTFQLTKDRPVENPIGNIVTQPAPKATTTKSTDPDHTVKMVLMGTGMSGKSRIRHYYFDALKEFNDYPPLIDCNVKTTTHSQLGRVKQQIWDINGQERYSKMWSTYCQGATVIFVVYDCTSLHSFSEVETCNSFIKTKMEDNVVKILVANKIDLRRVISTEQGVALANQRGFDAYHECSAVTGEGINELFQKALDLCYINITTAKSYQTTLPLVSSLQCFFNSWRSYFWGKTDFYFSPNGNYLVVGDLILNTHNWQKIEAISDKITCCAFSPDGNFLVTGVETAIIIWDAKRWKKITSLQSVITCCAFSPDSNLLITGTELSRSIIVWDVKKWEKIVTLESNMVCGGSAEVYWCTFSSDGQEFMACGYNSDINVWATNSWNRLGIYHLEYSTEQTSCSYFFKTKKLLLVTDGYPYESDMLFYKTEQDWSTITVLSIREQVDLFDEQLSFSVISPDEKMMVAGSFLKPKGYFESKIIKNAQSQIAVWQIGTWVKLKELIEFDNNQALSCCTFSPNGMICAVGSENGEINMWETIHWRHIKKVSTEEKLKKCHFSFDGNFFLTLNTEGSLKIFDAGFFLTIGPKTVQEYEQATKQGDLSAFGSLSALYKYGLGGVPANIEIAQFFEKCQRKDSHAFFEIGTHYYNGQVLTRDYDMAIFCYEQAAEQGHKEALTQLGNLYHDGLGVLKSLEKAEGYYSKATEKHHVPAMVRLGILAQKKGELAISRQWYKQAAEAGDTWSFYQLAERCCETNDRVSQDIKEAESYYFLGVRQGNSLSIATLHLWIYPFFKTYADQSTLKKRVDQLSKSFQSMNKTPDSFSRLKNIYEAGVFLTEYFTAEDFTVARNYYAQIALEGSRTALKNFALFYYFGLEVPVDIPFAEQCLQIAAEEPIILFSLFINSKKNEPSLLAARAMLIYSADNGDKETQYCLGFCHEKGLPSFNVDEDSAMVCYKKATDQGHLRALYRLGSSYEKKFRSTKEEHLLQQSVYCYVLAGNQHCTPAQKALEKLSHEPMIRTQYSSCFEKTIGLFNSISRMLGDCESPHHTAFIIAPNAYQVPEIAVWHLWTRIKRLQHITDLDLSGCGLTYREIASLGVLLKKDDHHIKKLCLANNLIDVTSFLKLLNDCGNKLYELDVRFNIIHVDKEQITERNASINDLLKINNALSLKTELKCLYIAGNYLPAGWKNSLNTFVINNELSLGGAVQKSRLVKGATFFKTQFIVVIAKSLDGQHVSLFLEGISEDNQCFLHRFHLLQDSLHKSRAEIVIEEYKVPNNIFETSQEHKGYSGVPFKLHPSQGENLIKNVEKHKEKANQGGIMYSSLASDNAMVDASSSLSRAETYNCLTWAKYHLKKVGIPKERLDVSYSPLPSMQLAAMQEDGRTGCFLQ